jgi:hypothetical protein
MRTRRWSFNREIIVPSLSSEPELPEINFDDALILPRWS